MNTFDLVVVGGGVAGVSAALAARAAGASVAMVRAGPGVTAMMAGGWSGVPPAGLVTALRTAGLELVPCSGRLPHPDGRLLECDVAPSSHAAASMAPGDDGPILVCGIDGVPGWRPAALAALLGDAAGLATRPLHGSVLLPQTPAAGWSEPSLAAWLEGEAGSLGEAVAKLVSERSARRVILPAVLGMEAHARVREAVQQAAGVPVGEMLGRAPSIPGWRLDRALLRCLSAAGVELVSGRVTSHSSQNGKAESVTVQGDAGPATIRGRAFILATGKFAGGGIDADELFAEPVFGSDVGISRFGETFRDPSSALALTDPARAEPQPVLGVGVGVAPYRNVVAAGSIRAGLETASTGLGTAAADGWAAGEKGAGGQWD